MGQGLGLLGSGVRVWVYSEVDQCQGLGLFGNGTMLSLCLYGRDQCQGWVYCRKRINVRVGVIVGRGSMSALGLLSEEDQCQGWVYSEEINDRVGFIRKRSMSGLGLSARGSMSGLGLFGRESMSGLGLFGKGSVSGLGFIRRSSK